MPLPLTKQDFKKYLYSDAETRYDFFVKRVKEDEETQTITIPVWPHPDFAMEFTKDNHIANCEAKELSLVKWMANWVPKLDEVSIEIAVFPTGDGECVTIEAKEFTEEIDPDVL